MAGDAEVEVEVEEAVLQLVRAEGLCSDGCLAEPCSDARRRSVAQVVNGKLVHEAIKRTRKRLVVHYAGVAGQTEAQHANFVRGALAGLYNDLWDVALEAGKSELDCIVMFTPLVAASADMTVFTAGKVSAPVLTGERVVALDAQLQEEVFGVTYSLWDNQDEPLEVFGRVAVGGTFDHCHNGHKKLLSIAASVCSERLTVGVTGASMLKGKKMGEQIESVETRKRHVEAFLDTVKPGLAREVPTIEDVWGPTASDASIEAIVLSTEVLKGARLINEERAKRGMPPLAVVAVARSNEHTLSSTFIRGMRGAQKQQGSL